MSAQVSVIVPHLNDVTNLEKCLAALTAQSVPREQMEIIVVDNGSWELPRDLLSRFPGVRLIEEAVPGPGPARNSGVAIACGQILAFTDSDCVVDRDWVAVILARFAADPTLEIIGGDMRILINTPGRPTAAEAFEMVYGFRQERQIIRQNFSATANLAMRSTVFQRVGPFAGIESVEDLDWGQRAARMGHRTRYVPEMIVYHPARHSMDALKALWDRHTSQHFRMRVTGPMGGVAWTFRALAMAVSPFFELPHVLSTKKLSTPSERWQAIRGLVAIRLYRARRMIRSLFDAKIRTASIKWNHR